MITPKIKALFQFIEYLHSNIENFNQYNSLIDELELLDKKRNKLSPENNYKDKLKYDEVKVEIEKKFDLLQSNTANLIKAKAKELNVCIFDNSPITNFNGIQNDIRQLKKNFSDKDLTEIFKHKSQYLKYRTKTPKTFLSLEMFFVDLDRLLKEFFEFFADNEAETDVLQETVIPVDSIEQAALYVSKGVKNVTFQIQSKPKTLSDFINENREKALALDLESFGALGYQILQKQKLNPDKEFIKKAIAELKNNLTNCLANNNHISDKSKQPNYLRDIRLYLEYSNILEQPKTEQEQPEILSCIITHEKAETIAEGIKTQYKNIKGKRLKLLLIALQELELLPKERIAKKFHTLCNNEFNWDIASYNAMNGYAFNTHTDTDEVKGMKQYIKTLLDTK